MNEIIKIYSAYSDMELDELKKLNPRQIMSGLISKIEDKRLQTNYKNLKVQEQLRFESAFANIFKEFDFEIGQNYIWLIFKMISKDLDNTLDEEARLIRLLSQVNPDMIKLLSILYHWQDELGEIEINKVKKQLYFQQSDLMALKSLGLLTEIVYNMTYDKNGEYVAINSYGYKILGIHKYQDGFPYDDTNGILHNIFYKASKPTMKIDIESLKDFVITIDLSLREIDGFSSSEGRAKIYINSLDRSVGVIDFLTETRDSISEWFESKQLNENAMEYLLSFNKDYVGLDFYWRLLKKTLKLYDESIEKYWLYKEKNLETKFHTEILKNLRDFRKQYTYILDKALELKHLKNRNGAFYYQYK